MNEPEFWEQSTTMTYRRSPRCFVSHQILSSLAFQERLTSLVTDTATMPGF